MEQVLNYLYWMKDNYAELLSSLAAILLGLEMLVRLTPTKKDDGAIERVGHKLRWIMNLLKVPNVKAADSKILGVLPKPDGNHSDS